MFIKLLIISVCSVGFSLKINYDSKNKLCGGYFKDLA